jgi:hypothetical protein
MNWRNYHFWSGGMLKMRLNTCNSNSCLVACNIKFTGQICYVEMYFFLFSDLVLLEGKYKTTTWLIYFHNLVFIDKYNKWLYNEIVCKMYNKSTHNYQFYCKCKYANIVKINFSITHTSIDFNTQYQLLNIKFQILKSNILKLLKFHHSKIKEVYH